MQGRKMDEDINQLERAIKINNCKDCEIHKWKKISDTLYRPIENITWRYQIYVCIKCDGFKTVKERFR
jgi:hypothetical protein